MGEINNILGNSGAPVPLVANGKTYLLSRVTKRIQAQFEAYLEEQALIQVEKLERRLKPELFVKLLGDVTEKIARGHYSFGGEAAQAALTSVKGGMYFLALLIREHQQISDEEVEGLLVNHSPEVMGALERLLGGKGQAPEQTGQVSQ